jgi:hypothetical protein
MTLTLFSAADLRAAEVVDRNWPTDQVVRLLASERGGEAGDVRFEPFEQCNPSMSDGWSSFKDAADRETSDLIGGGFKDRKGLDDVRSAIERLCRHEQAREIRIVRRNWPSE